MIRQILRIAKTSYNPRQIQYKSSKTIIKINKPKSNHFSSIGPKDQENEDQKQEKDFEKEQTKWKKFLKFFAIYGTAIGVITGVLFQATTTYSEFKKNKLIEEETREQFSKKKLEDDPEAYLSQKYWPSLKFPESYIEVEYESSHAHSQTQGDEEFIHIHEDLFDHIQELWERTRSYSSTATSEKATSCSKTSRRSKEPRSM